MLTRWLALIRGLRRRNEIAREVDEEVEFHLHQEAERHRALGATLEEARLWPPWRSEGPPPSN